MVKDSNFLLLLYHNKSERQLSRIKAWTSKKYLKHSLHEVNKKDLLLLIGNKSNKNFSNTKAHCMKIFQK